MKRIIPGTVPIQGREFRYVECPSKEAFADLFPRMGEIAGTPNPQSGGAISENTIITLPGAKKLFGVSYKGDLLGWRTEVEKCCRVLNLLCGEVRGNQIVVASGEAFALSDCSIEFY